MPLLSAAPHPCHCCSDRCGARFHLGKAGLNEVVVKNEGCWDGAKEYPQTWCHFGCAVQVRPRVVAVFGRSAATPD